MASATKSTLALITGRTLAFSVTFFIPVLLVRLFDQEAFGTYKQVFLIYGTLYGIAQVGMAESLYYFLPQDTERAGRYVMNAMVLLALSGAACVAGLSLARGALGSWLGNPQISAYVPLVGLYLLLMLMTTVLEIAMISRKRYLSAAGSYVIWDVLRAAFFLAPGILTQRLDWVLAGALGFGLVRLVGAAVYLARHFRNTLRFDPRLLLRQLAYALPFQAAVLLEVAQFNFHQYAVSFRFDPAVFAIYSVGCLQLPFVEFVAGPAANVMMVRMAEEIREGRARAVREIWRDTTRRLALAFLPMFAVVMVCAREMIVTLFTEQYAASIPIFMVWSVAVLLAVLQTDSVLRVYAQTHFLVKMNFFRLVLIAVLIGWLMTRFGLLGAVFATMLGALAAKVLGLSKAASLMELRLRDALPWRSLARTGLSPAPPAVPALLVKLTAGLGPMASLIAAGSVYTATYGLFLFVFDVLTPGERQALAGWLRRPEVSATIGIKSRTGPAGLVTEASQPGPAVEGR